MRNYKSRIKTLAIRENPLLCRRPDTYSFLVGEPLINLPFCPNNAIMAGFSGSFARCPLSAISGCHYGSLICLTRQKVNSQNSSIKSDRYSVCTTTPFTPDDPTWTGSCGVFVSTACGPVGSSSPPQPSSN